MKKCERVKEIGERTIHGRVEREVSRARCFGKLREEPFPRFCDGMCGVVAGGHATACATRTCPRLTRANTANSEEFSRCLNRDVMNVM